MNKLQLSILMALFAVAACSYGYYTLQKALLVKKARKSGIIEAVLEKIAPSGGASTSATSVPTVTPATPTTPGRFKRLIAGVKTKWNNSWTGLKTLAPWHWVKKHWFWASFITIILIGILISMLFKLEIIR